MTKRPKEGFFKFIFIVTANESFFYNFQSSCSKETREGTELGWEPWSSGYERRRLFQRSWVWIPALYTGWTFFTHLFIVKILMCVWKDENKLKRGRGLAHFLKKKKPTWMDEISDSTDFLSCALILVLYFQKSFEKLNFVRTYIDPNLWIKL